MQQHPIPQNVTTYQFRLIGDMTIKQFIYLSVGVGAAIFFYYTNLFSLIKWLLVIGSAMMGFAVAFLPMEERPLDQWILAYIRAIYRPTRFIWKKSNPLPGFFSFVLNSTILPADAQELARAAAIRKQQGLRSYLITLPQDQINIDAQEQAAVGSILGLFASPTSPSTPAPETALNITAPAFESNQTPLTGDAGSVASTNQNAHPFTTPSSGIIAAQPVQIEKVDPATTAASPTTAQDLSAQPASNMLATESPTSPTVIATTAANLPFPSTPSTPNTVVGMVLDGNEKIVDNSIIEVIDETGLPVRATKTNQLGQFFSTTPLKRGTYHITIEKPGLSFDTIELSLNGQIVEPLKIQAKE